MHKDMRTVYFEAHPLTTEIHCGTAFYYDCGRQWGDCDCGNDLLRYENDALEPDNVYLLFYTVIYAPVMTQHQQPVELANLQEESQLHRQDPRSEEHKQIEQPALVDHSQDIVILRQHESHFSRPLNSFRETKQAETQAFHAHIEIFSTDDQDRLRQTLLNIYTRNARPLLPRIPREHPY